MREDGVIELLMDHLSSNECMILSVGDLNSLLCQDRFRVGQTYHNNQDAVVELAGFGYFPEGTLFAVKPRPRRKGREIEALTFVEVIDGELMDRKFADVKDRVTWSRVLGIVEGRVRWEKRIAEHHTLDLEMDEASELTILLGVEIESHRYGNA